jgi:glutathione S-transferase
MATLTLFSARACPFAHRTRLVLTQKGVDFELQEIDLQNKPSWFTAVSGYGKVPAIEHQGLRIWESAVINEYLDEVFPSPPLLPKAPGPRAVARIWIDWANTRLAPPFGALLRGASEALREGARRELLAALEVLDGEGFAKTSGSGPFFFGAAPGLVDFTLYPWFERWPALDQIERGRGADLPIASERIATWLSRMAELPAAKAHQSPVAFYVERFRAYAAPAPAATASSAQTGPARA